MMNRIASILTALFLVFSSVSATAQERGTLILMVDVSSSISPSELRLQYEGYEKALYELRGILHGMQIEVITFGQHPEHVHSGNSLTASAFFGSRKMSGERGWGNMTCPVGGLEYIVENWKSWTPPVIIDITGDGEQTDAYCFSKKEIWEYRNEIENLGGRVNALLIKPITQMAPHNQVRQFYRRLPTNNGEFMMHAENFDKFQLAIMEKIIAEVGYLDEKYRISPRPEAQNEGKG